MLIRKGLSTLVASALLMMGSTSTISASSFGEGFVGGVIGGVIGSAIANQPRRVHRVHHRKKRVHHKKKRVHHKKKVAKKKIVITPEMKIQKSLASLGFYRGKIDGEINSFETRSAIKAMNKAYNISNTASLDRKTRDALIYMGDLFKFDRNLIARGNDKKAKAKKIQTALKVHGFYFDKIDGSIGPATRAKIADYQRSKGLTPTGTLDFEEEYQLISSAKKLVEKNLEETMSSLKVATAKNSKKTPTVDNQKPSVETKDKEQDFASVAAAQDQ